MRRWTGTTPRRSRRSGSASGRTRRPSRSRTSRSGAKSYVLEMLPYPSGSLHMGHMLVYTIGDVVTHFRARNGMHVLHPQGFDSFGLPAENAAIREGGPPARDHRAEHRSPSRARCGGSAGRTTGIARHSRRTSPTTTAGSSGSSCASSSAGSRTGRRAPVKWCPNDQTVLANEQVQRRALRALRRRGRVAADGAVVLPDHGLRAGAARRPRDGRLAGVDQGAPAQLDRPLGGRGDPVPDRGARRGRPGLHDAAGHALRRDLLRPRARARARARASSSDEVREYVRRAAAKKTAERAAATEKTGVFTGLHAVEPRERRAAARLRRRLRPDRLRDGRDHGRARARPARLRLRAGVRPPDPPGRAAGRRRGRRERRRTSSTPRARCSSTPASSTACRRRDGGRRIVEKLEAEGRGRFAVNYRLRDWGFSRQRYWGCPIPVVYCDACGIVPVPDDAAAGRPPGDRGLQAEGRAAARAGGGLGERAVPALRRAGEARDRDDGHVRRLVLVLPALLRPAQRHRAVRPRGRRLLEPGRPLHRRRRPRDRCT